MWAVRSSRCVVGVRRSGNEGSALRPCSVCWKGSRGGYLVFGSQTGR